jgi:hypothetical protein
MGPLESMLHLRKETMFSGLDELRGTARNGAVAAEINIDLFWWMKGWRRGGLGRRVVAPSRLGQWQPFKHPSGF